MNTKNRTFKKELSYYQNKYLLDMMNQTKPINEPIKPGSKKNIHDKIIKVIEFISFALFALVLMTSLGLFIKTVLSLF
jgi:hypothetical protein